MKKEIEQMLNKPLDRSNVSERQQSGMTLSYIEGHHVIREANRIFGFDGWSMRVMDFQQQHTGQNRNGNETAYAYAQVEVNALGVTRVDVGYGQGIARSIGDAMEGAGKEAVTDAMKRAFRTFGDQFGNALYDKQQKHVVDVLDDDALLAIKEAGSITELKDVWENVCRQDTRYTDTVNARKAEL